jgi:hypothetical protein
MALPIDRRCAERAYAQKALVEVLALEMLGLFTAIKERAAILKTCRLGVGDAITDLLAPLHLDTPWLRLFVWRQADTLSTTPDSPWPDTTLLAAGNAQSRRIAAARQSAAADLPAAPQPQPRESLRRYLARAKAHWTVAQEIFHSIDPPPTRWPEVRQHVEWFVHVLKGASITAASRKFHVSRRAMQIAVKKVSAALELPLRPLPRTGRPKGSKDTASRSHIVRESKSHK